MISGVALAGCVGGTAGSGSAESSEAITHVWARDGVDHWSSAAISASGTHAGNSLHVHDARGRIEVKADERDENYREWWARSGTNWADSEVRSVWYPPSSLDVHVCAPQMGHVHRGTPSGGVVVDQNVFEDAFDETYLGEWAWNGTALQIGRHETIPARCLMLPRIVGVGRDVKDGVARYVYLVDSTCGVQVGDVVTATGCTDDRFNSPELEVVQVAPSSTPKLGAGPLIITKSARSGSPISPKPEIGVIDFATPGSAGSMVPRRVYPMHVASRVMGRTLTAKRWPANMPEPAWGDPNWSATLELAAGPETSTSTPGHCGILSNHLYNGGWVEYGDVSFTRL